MNRLFYSLLLLLAGCAGATDKPAPEPEPLPVQAPCQPIKQLGASPITNYPKTLMERAQRSLAAHYVDIINLGLPQRTTNAMLEAEKKRHQDAYREILRKKGYTDEQLIDSFARQIK